MASSVDSSARSSSDLRTRVSSLSHWSWPAQAANTWRSTTLTSPTRSSSLASSTTWWWVPSAAWSGRASTPSRLVRSFSCHCFNALCVDTYSWCVFSVKENWRIEKVQSLFLNVLIPISHSICDVFWTNRPRYARRHQPRWLRPRHHPRWHVHPRRPQHLPRFRLCRERQRRDRLVVLRRGAQQLHPPLDPLLVRINIFVGVQTKSVPLWGCPQGKPHAWSQKWQHTDCLTNMWMPSPTTHEFLHCITLMLARRRSKSCCSFLFSNF